MFKRLVAISIVTATVVAGGAAFAGATTSSTGTASTPSCSTGSWPQRVEGRPAGVKAGMTGVALWHDSTGWHLRASEAGLDRAVFVGTVSTDGALVSVRRHLEGGDVTLTPGAHGVAYKFTNYGGVDGIDFGALCGSTITVTALLDGHVVPASHIVIGAGNTHPNRQPIVIHRVAS
jgi:hypothetical protein